METATPEQIRSALSNPGQQARFRARLRETGQTSGRPRPAPRKSAHQKRTEEARKRAAWLEGQRGE